MSNYKFIHEGGVIYSAPLPKWKKHLKKLLAYKLSLLKKNPLPHPDFLEVKVVASKIFEMSKLTADDCIDVIKEELFKFETNKEVTNGS